MTVPVSVTVARALVAHVNAGVSHLPGAQNEDGTRVRRTDWLFGGSLIWLARQNLNLLRGAINTGSVQIVPGIAMPVAFYLSVEHPLR